MYLFPGILILSCVFLHWSVALICCRNPQPHWYGKTTMQTYFWTLPCVAGLVFGLVLVGKSLPGFPPSMMETALSAGTIVITVLIYRLLGVRKRLSELEDNQGTVIAIDSHSERTSTPTAEQVSRRPVFKKAA